MTRYAVVDGENVTNVILWDGEIDYHTDAGTLIECPDKVGPGWTYVDEEWVAPPTPEPDPDIEQQGSEQEALRQSAIDKLTALGLTEEEARAIVGI